MPHSKPGPPVVTGGHTDDRRRSEPAEGTKKFTNGGTEETEDERRRQRILRARPIGDGQQRGSSNRPPPFVLRSLRCSVCESVVSVDLGCRCSSETERIVAMRSSRCDLAIVSGALLELTSLEQVAPLVHRCGGASWPSWRSRPTRPRWRAGCALRRSWRTTGASAGEARIGRASGGAPAAGAPGGRSGTAPGWGSGQHRQRRAGAPGRGRR